jgi:hypothetical protein
MDRPRFRFAWFRRDVAGPRLWRDAEKVALPPAQAVRRNAGRCQCTVAVCSLDQENFPYNARKTES